MSATNHSQPNNKKGSQQNGPGVNSATNTSAQASNTNGNMAPQQQLPPPSQSTSPPANNAPKYGTLVPNRVFVGGIAANTTEGELAQLFSAYGTVKATKIISDRAGVSKGYGFVTFESEEEAKRLQRESDNIMLRERRLNIAPAIKKQPFNRSFDVPSPPPNAAAQTQFYYTAAAAGGVPYAYQNGMAYYTTPPQTSCTNGDPTAPHTVYQAPPVYATPTAAPPTAPYPMPIYPPQPLFVHQQYPYQAIPYDLQQFYGSGSQGINGPAQYMYGSGVNGNSNGATSTTGNVNVVTQSNVCGTASAYAPIATSSTNGITTIPARLSHTTTTFYQPLACNTSDGMFYNVPVFNVTIDSSGNIYTESVDNYTTGNTETMVQNSTSGAASGIVTSSPYSASGCGAMSKNNQSHQNHSNNQYSHSNHHHNHTHNQNQQAYVYGCAVPVAERNGYQQQSSEKITPVVSLLSVGQANERDYRSMQGGRKHRPSNASIDTSIPTNSNNDNVTVNGIQSLRITGAAMSYLCASSMNGYPLSATSANKQYHRRNDKCDSNQCKTWARKRRGHNGCTIAAENSSLSSIRTSSNSSPNAVFDENLNEKKDKHLNDSSPPPTAYSPMLRSFPTENCRHVFQNNPCRSANDLSRHTVTSNTNSRRVRRSTHQRRNHGQSAHSSTITVTVTGTGSGTSTTATNTAIATSTTPTELGAGAPTAPLTTNLDSICEKVDSIKL